MLNLHIYPSSMENESRIYRITQTIAEKGISGDIILVGIEDSRYPEYDSLDEYRRIWRVGLWRLSRLPWKVRRVLKYVQWLLKIYCRFRKEKIGMINCHSLYDLPVGVWLKRKTGCRLIYDTHELETERNGLREGLVKRVMKKMEKRYIPKVDHTFVVGDSIAEWYRKTYSIATVSTVKNIPTGKTEPGKKSAKLREIFDVPADRLLFIYQGGFFKGRSIPLLLDVFSRDDVVHHIVFMGFGEYAEDVREAQREHANIHFLDAVPPDQVVEYTSSADIGFSLIENTCLSYYYSLPNKVYEYLMSGIPGIVSDFPDMRAFIDRYDCGWPVAVNTDSVYTLVKHISENPGPLIEEKKKSIERLMTDENFGWETEKQKMIDVYRRLEA